MCICILDIRIHMYVWHMHDICCCLSVIWQFQLCTRVLRWNIINRLKLSVSIHVALKSYGRYQNDNQTHKSSFSNQTLFRQLYVVWHMLTYVYVYMYMYICIYIYVCICDICIHKSIWHMYDTCCCLSVIWQLQFCTWVLRWNIINYVKLFVSIHAALKSFVGSQDDNNQSYKTSFSNKTLIRQLYARQIKSLN